MENHAWSSRRPLLSKPGLTLGAENTLMYILAHKDTDAAKKSFDEFRADPDWVAAKAASEKEGGGSLTIGQDAREWESRYGALVPERAAAGA